MSDSEGTMYQRGSDGQAPDALSVTSADGAKSDTGTIGANEHVTAYGQGWHRSWDNPGTKNDHSTDHKSGEKTQH
jgi:hypothetical protein